MYKLLITQADFLSPKEFVEKYSNLEKSVQAFVEDYDETDNHTTGYTIRKISPDNLVENLKEIYDTENLRGECMSIYKDDKEIFTENDFDFWSA